MIAENKVFVITGAGSGIGRELALLLLKKGASVAGADLKPGSLEETGRLAGEKGDRFLPITLNVADREKVFQLPEKVKQHFGQVDGLINNAGIIQPFVPVINLEDDLVSHVMDVNFYGTYYMTKAFLPGFLERPEAHIVNISSMGGFMPFPKQTAYGASKAAVKLFTEGLYAELRHTRVKVTVVYPGAVNTDITQNSGVAAPANSTESTKASAMGLAADRAAEIIVKGMERNKFRLRVGKDAVLLDTLYRLNPRFAINFMSKMMEKMMGEAS